jgi:hypothetical protein
LTRFYSLWFNSFHRNTTGDYMTNVHPLFQAAIAPLAPPSALTEYHAALQSFDWQYDFSDSHERWAKGNNALARLRAMQAVVDPTGEIWMAQPGAQGHGAPAPRIKEAA